MNLKAILSDFDGTLVNKQNIYSSEVKELLDLIKNRNVHFSLATGRAYFGRVQKFLSALNLFNYHIFNGGALIFNNKNNKILFKQPISSDSINKIINYLLETRLNFSCETINLAYMNKVIKEPYYAKLSSMRPLNKLSDKLPLKFPHSLQARKAVVP